MDLKINKSLKILLFTNGLVNIAAAMLGPIYALFVKEIGGDLFDASVAVSIFAFVAGLTTIVSGYYADKMPDNKIIVIFGYALIAVGFLLMTRVESMLGIALTQSLIGIGEAIYLPAFDEEYSRHIERENAGKEWSLWESMHYFSMAVGASVGGVVVTKFGFDFVFILMSFMVILSLLVLIRLPRKAI